MKKKREQPHLAQSHAGTNSAAMDGWMTSEVPTGNKVNLTSKTVL